MAVPSLTPMACGIRTKSSTPEIFKFVDGKITRVEAVFEGPQSYMRGTGWPGGTKAESRPIGQ